MAMVYARNSSDGLSSFFFVVECRNVALSVARGCESRAELRIRNINSIVIGPQCKVVQ